MGTDHGETSGLVLPSGLCTAEKPLPLGVHFPVSDVDWVSPSWELPSALEISMIFMMDRCTSHRIIPGFIESLKLLS